MLSHLSPVPKWTKLNCNLQRVITLSRVLSSPLPIKMTRFGFLSLALLSLQAFVGIGFAAVSSISFCVTAID